MAQIRSRWELEGKEAPFVACGVTNPDYVCMTAEESAYYFYWRTMVRKGKYLRTSSGYLFLFTAEIINTDTDAENNLRMLVNVTRVYSSMDQVLMDGIADACVTYAKIHSLKVPEMERAGDFRVVSFHITRALKKDPVAPIPHRILKRLLFAGDRQYMDSDHPYGELMTQALRNIEEYVREMGGKRIIQTFGPVKRSQYDVYPEFPYMGDRLRVSVDMLDLSTGSRARDFLRVTLKMLLREVRVAEGLDAPLPVRYPPSYRNLLYELVREWKRGRWSPGDLDKGEMVLDMASVRNARSDLDAVSYMMYTEGAEEEEKEETVPVEVPEEDDPWKAFASVLDDTQRGYLKAAMEGNASAFLKQNGLRMSAVEEGINNAAMDTVGDTVVEDGTIFEDYTENVRDAI